MNPPWPDPPFVKRRLPFPEQISLLKGGGRRLGVFLLAIAALLCAGATYYALAVRGLAPATPEVLAPGFGAVYFGLRFFMAVRPRPDAS